MSTDRNTTDLLLPLVSCTSPPTSMPRRGTQATNPSRYVQVRGREGGRKYSLELLVVVDVVVVVVVVVLVMGLVVLVASWSSMP